MYVRYKDEKIRINLFSLANQRKKKKIRDNEKDNLYEFTLMSILHNI